MAEPTWVDVLLFIGAPIAVFVAVAVLSDMWARRRLAKRGS